MTKRAARQHIGAFALALIVVLVLQVQDIDLQPWIGAINEQWFQSHTPIFAGMDNLDKHEVFAPLYRNTKKIVLLGASTVDSVGCDGTWHRPDPTRDPPNNAAYECSIANQLNIVLKKMDTRVGGSLIWRAMEESSLHQSIFIRAFSTCIPRLWSMRTAAAIMIGKMQGQASFKRSTILLQTVFLRATLRWIKLGRITSEY